MITVLYGEDMVGSRQHLQGLKEAFTGEVITIDGRTVDQTGLIQATASNSLFAASRLVVVEHFFQGKKKRPDLSKLAGEVIFWEADKINFRDNHLPSNWQLKEFKPPTLIFKFADSLGVKPAKETVLALTEVLKISPPEFVLAMIVRQFRLMLDPTQAQPWQARTLISQRKYFEKIGLAKIYRHLLDIDFKSKTGGLVGTLAQELKYLLTWRDVGDTSSFGSK